MEEITYDSLWTQVLTAALLVNNPNRQEIEKLKAYSTDLEYTAKTISKNCEMCGKRIARPRSIKSRYTAGFLIPKYYDLLPFDDKLAAAICLSYLLEYIQWRYSNLCIYDRIETQL